MTSSYDVLVLGSGPAGFYAALCCAKGGLNTAIIEKSLWGGTGFATGCLPLKLMLDKIRTEAASLSPVSPGQGSDSSYLEQLYSDFRTHIDNVSQRQIERLKNAGVEIYESDGRFLDRNSYKTDKTLIKADKIIVATGTEPDCFDDVPFSSRILSHKEVLGLSSIPQSLLIIGGDVEGIEFASLFSHWGTKVTVIEKLPEILPGYDRLLVEPVIKSLKEKCVDFQCSTEVVTLRERADHVKIKTTKGEFRADIALITGLRKSSIPAGLKELGIRMDQDFISVDENFESSIPGIYAIGDINGLMGMAGAAIQQAVHLTDYIIHSIKTDIDYSILPRAVFSIPQICGGGLQEKDLDNKEKYTIKKITLNRTWRSMYKSSTEGFVSIILDENDIVKGIWFVGSSAEMHGSSLAFILANETSLKDLKRSLFIHPTEFESILEAGIL